MSFLRPFEWISGFDVFDGQAEFLGPFDFICDADAIFPSGHFQDDEDFGSLEPCAVVGYPVVCIGWQLVAFGWPVPMGYGAEWVIALVG